METLTELDRKKMTIERLVSNLPEAIRILKEAGKHNLARQIQNDLENLISFTQKGWFDEPTN